MKHIYHHFLAGLLLATLSTSLPAQYAGGRSDGFSTHRTVQLTVDGVPAGVTALYLGGKDDGFGHQGATQTVNGTNLLQLYAGGRDDGFDRNGGSFAIGGENLLVLYGGGRDDGFDRAVNSLTISGTDVNVLYGGGRDDGFDRMMATSGISGQSFAALYAGGPDDGFDVNAFTGSTGGKLLMLYGGGPDDGFDRAGNSSTISGFDLTTMFGGGRDDGFDVGSFAGTVPLPLTLIAFDAFPEDKFVLLRWVTEDEVNTDFFTIEKTRDGRDFNFVGETLAAGSTEPGEQAHYELKDHQPYEGTSFYRLKTTDFDGLISLSHLVEVQYSSPSDWDFTLFPNPNTGRHFSVRPAGLKGNEELQLQIFDANGRLLRSETVPNSGNAPHRFDLERRLPAGSYLIRMTSGDGLSRAKLLLVGG